MVNGFCHRRQQVGIAVAVARDQAADLGAVGQRCHRSQQRPGFKVIPPVIAIGWDEMILVPDRVHAQRLDLAHRFRIRTERGVLWLKQHADTQSLHGSLSRWIKSCTADVHLLTRRAASAVSPRDIRENMPASG